MSAIFYVSSLPVVPVSPGGWDKVAHTAEYAGLAVLLVRGLAGGLPARVRLAQAVAAIAIAVTYGATDEWHQSFISGRFSDVRDLAGDALGACIGTAICWAWGIIWLRPDR
jgi:VanZ family protein